MDLSKLSDEDLTAISNGDMQSVSDDGLVAISGFDDAKAKTTGQPANLEMPDERSRMEQRSDSFDTPYQNETFKHFGEIGGGYHSEAFGGTVGGRAIIGGSKAILKPVQFATRVAEHLLGGDIDSPDSYSGFVGNFISDLNKLRDRGMVRQGIGNQPDVAGTGSEIGVTLGLMAKARIADLLGGKAGKFAAQNPLKTQMVEGGIMGGVLGAVESQSESQEPYSFEKTKEDAKNMAVLGTVAPVVVKAGAKTLHEAKRFVKHPFTSNPMKLYRKSLGDDKNLIDETLAQMRVGKSEVPGVKLTVAQTIAKNEQLALKAPQVAALEDIAQAVSPQELWKAKRLQAALRIKEVQKISGKSPRALEAAKIVRRNAAKPFYEAAEKSKTEVVVQPVIKEIDSILSVHGNESIAKPLSAIKYAMTKTAKMTQADKDAAPGILKVLKDSGAFGKALKSDPDGVLAAEKILSGQGGKKAASNTTVQKMASLSRGIKEMMKAETATGKALYDNGLLSKVKTSLDKQIEAVDKNYAKAQELYKKHSVLVDRTESGQKLMAKLTDSMEISERGAAFAKEINNLKTKQAYGKPLWESLSKDQQKSMENVLSDLHANAEYVAMSKAAMKDTQTATKSTGIGPIGAFQPLISAARSRIDAKMGVVNRRGFKELAKLMQNPEKFADMVEKGTPKQKEAMSKILHKWVTTPGIVFGVKESKEPK